MMVSTAGQMMNGQSEPDVPVGALVHADFLGGIYWDGATLVAADAAIDIPGQITASGLEIEDDEANLLGGFLTSAVALNWTAFIEYEHTFDTDAGLFVVSNDAGDELLEIYRGGLPNRQMICEESGDSEYREVIDTDSHALGIHRVALTRTAAKLVMSVDGDPIVSDTSAMDFNSPAKAALGGYPGFGTRQWVTIRTFTLYPPMDDGDLPGLSSL